MKENREEIVESGRNLVEIRKDVSGLKNGADFQTVRKRRAAKTAEPPRTQEVSLSNRYSCLAEEETYLLGDSIVCEQTHHFAKRKRNRKVKSYRGCRTRKVTAEIEKLELSDRDSCVIAHVGSNDLFLRNNKTSNTEPIVKELKSLIDTIKRKTNRGMVVGILPRINVSYYALSKAICINDRIKEYCIKKQVKFVDPWDNFIGKHIYFKKDGIHLNNVGSKRLGDILNTGYEDLIKQRTSSPEEDCIEIDPQIGQMFRDSDESVASFEGFSKEN